MTLHGFAKRCQLQVQAACAVLASCCHDRANQATTLVAATLGWIAVRLQTTTFYHLSAQDYRPIFLGWGLEWRTLLLHDVSCPPLCSVICHLDGLHFYIQNSRGSGTGHENIYIQERADITKIDNACNVSKKMAFEKKGFSFHGHLTLLHTQFTGHKH